MIRYDEDGLRLYEGEALAVLSTLPDASVQMCVTSPPYWGLRDYGHGDDGIGLEASPDAYVAALVAVFREVRRVLRDDGTLWLNLGDSYSGSGRGMNGDGSVGAVGEKQATNAGSMIDMHDKRVDAGAIGRYWVKPPQGYKPKDLIGIPWLVAFALQRDGWYLRSDIIWSKPNPMPESVKDRPTKAHEYIFLLAKQQRYYFDQDAVREPGVEPDRQRHDRIGGANGHTVRHSEGGMMGASEGRNVRTVWTIPTQPSPLPHFAAFPEEMATRCIKAGCPEGGVVLDPFCGTGTTLKVARDLGRQGIGIDLSPEYCDLAAKRLAVGIKGVMATMNGQGLLEQQAAAAWRILEGRLT